MGLITLSIAELNSLTIGQLDTLPMEGVASTGPPVGSLMMMGVGR